MRLFFASLLLAACATNPPPAPPVQVAGCWINRGVGAMSMRWLPDPAHTGALRGTRTEYGQTGADRRARFSLESSGEGWTLSELNAEGAAATHCWQVAQGEGGSLDGGRVFIDRHGDRLRIVILGGGAEQLIFQGRREGCD